MNPIERLKLEAREKRDGIIAAARAEYAKTLKIITRAERALRGAPRTTILRQMHQRSLEGGEFAGWTAVSAALRVLQERGEPMRLIEICVEIQARGCRPGDEPRRLMNNLAASMRYHAGRFKKGEDGRWVSIISHRQANSAGLGEL